MRILPGEVPTAGVGTAVQSPSVQRIITAALQGQLPRSKALRPLIDGEVLHERHIQVILMRAGGFRNTEIASALGYTPVRVGQILNHPDAETILAALLSYAADNVVDVRTRMRLHANEMIDHIVETARTTKNENARLTAAFGLLDRAGYGAVQKVESKHQIVVEGNVASDLREALRESREIRDVDYTIHTSRQLSAPAEESGEGAGGAQSASEAGSPAQSEPNSDRPPYPDSPEPEPLSEDVVYMVVREEDLAA